MSDRRIHSEFPDQGGLQNKQVARERAVHPPQRRLGRFCLLYNQAKGLYRLQEEPVEVDDASTTGYTEIEDYASPVALKTMLRHWPNLFGFIAYDDGAHGVAVSSVKDLPETWLTDEDYHPFVLFNDEAEARRYAEERRSLLARRKTAA